MLSLFLLARRLWRGIRRNVDDPEFRALLIVAFMLLLSGTVFYSRIEGWSALDALYFSTITLTTVGYGDFAPQTSFGKVFTIIYILVGIGIFVALGAKIAIAQLNASRDPDPGPPAVK